MNSRPDQPDSTIAPGVGVVIRFKNSRQTLPTVLDALQRLKRPPELVLGVDTGSSDGSEKIFHERGFEVIPWNQPYHHSKALNFGINHCRRELILVLSSHTILRSEKALALMRDAMEDPRTACVSAKWDRDGFLSDAIRMDELRQRGMKLGSIYSDSMGMIRRKLWETHPFDETLVTMEDYAWALDQAEQGYTVKRLEFDFSYQRSGQRRDFTFACIAFRLASKHKLKLVWLGPKATVIDLLRACTKRPKDRAGAAKRTESIQLHWAHLRAWARWRSVNPDCEI